MLAVIEAWYPETAQWPDSYMIRLEKDLEAALGAVIPSDDGRRANGRKPEVGET